MEIDCVFTRDLEKPSYIKSTESEILNSLENSVSHFISLTDCDVVYIKERGFKRTGGLTPQPYIKIVLECDSDPQSELIKRQVSIIGDADYFDEELFPVKLLGPKYWVSDSVERSIDSIQEEREKEAQSQSKIDGIVERIFNSFN